PALIAGTSHGDRRVRLEAARTLGETGGPGAAGTLARMVERDAVFSNRLHAALGLTQLSAAGDRDARDALAVLVAKLGALMESTDVEAAGDAGRLLGSIGEPARETLMAKLAHPRPEIRIRAIVELDSLKTAVVPALSKAADDPEGQVRAAAVASLGLLAMRDEPDSAAGIPVIKSKLKDPDPEVRAAATRALENAAAR